MSDVKEAVDVLREQVGKVEALEWKPNKEDFVAVLSALPPLLKELTRLQKLEDPPPPTVLKYIKIEVEKIGEIYQVVEGGFVTRYVDDDGTIVFNGRDGIPKGHGSKVIEDDATPAFARAALDAGDGK